MSDLKADKPHAERLRERREREQENREGILRRHFDNLGASHLRQTEKG